MNNTNKSHLNEYIKSRPKEILPTTIKGYELMFNNIQKEFGIDIDFKKMSLKDLEYKIEKSEYYKLGTKLKFLIIVNIIRGNDEPKLVKLIEEYKYKTKQATDKKTEEVIEQNITFKDLIKDMNEEENDKYYLIKYILIHYGVRNKDLVINKTDDKELYNQYKNNKKDGNLLYVNKNKVYYVRTNYKTKTIYGIKENIIDDVRFNIIVQNITNDDSVFVNKNNKTYTDTEIPIYIMRMYNKSFKNSKLSEGKIYKIIVNHYQKNQEMLKKYADTRGHSSSTQIKTYMA